MTSIRRACRHTQGTQVRTFKFLKRICCSKPLYNFPSGTAIKTCVDVYTLRLISRRCEDHRHYGSMVYSCHARLTPTPARHSGKNIHRIDLILNTLWRGTFNDQRHHPRTFDRLTCHRSSGRWFYIGLYFYLLHNLIITPPCWSNSYMPHTNC